MSLELALANLMQPPILFFFLGVLAATLGSDLDLPQPIPKALSLYLLVAIGIKGGLELAGGEGGLHVVTTLAAAVGFAALSPIPAFLVLRRAIGAADAAAVAATYGSVSAVTFIAATSFLERLGVATSGTMVAAMALMESPAILVGVLLHRRFAGASRPIAGVASPAGEADPHQGSLLRDALLNGSVFVLLGSLVIGALAGPRGEAALAPFVRGLFPGVLCLFLLDMGLVSGRRLAGLRRLVGVPLAFGLGAPLVHAACGIALASVLGLPVGEAFLFTVLCASASYIAVPAALRVAIPEANPGLYVTMALAMTFPFNLLIGLPLYYAVVRALWGGAGGVP